MHPLSDALQSGILSRQAVGVALILAIAALIAVNRSLGREILHDPARGWRSIAWMAGITGGATLAWTTIFDDWLQLIAEPYRLSMKWDYQRIQFDPIDPALRTVTIGLVAACIVLLGLLVARHVPGYLFQIGGLLVATLAWIPIFILNQRLTALILQGASDDATLGEVAGLTMFWMLRLAFGVIAIGISIAAVTLVVSLACSLVLDLLRAREPRVTREADAFFTSFQNRVEEAPERPIQSYWRPIERPM